MNKKTATLNLTERLNKLGYHNIVFNPRIQNHLLKTAKSVVFDLKDKLGIENLADTIPIEPLQDSPQIIELKGKYPSANYFFLDFDSKEPNDAPKIHAPKNVITPLAMIGEIEEETLKKIFYKNLPNDVTESFKALKIESFIEQYKIYCSSDETLENLIPGRGVFVPFKSGMEIEVGDICRGVSGTFYLLDMASNGCVGGPGFKDKKLTKPSRTYNYRTFDSTGKECEKNFFNKAFLDFIFFSLPYEDQNLETNKILIQHMKQDLDLERIMIKEYSKGEYFKEYFECLDKEEQENVVEEIESLKPVEKYGRFLWNLGFKDVKLDYIRLYKEDAQGFIEYFQRRTEEDKRTIMQSLFSLDFKNPEVITWLDQNELRLIQEIGMAS